MTGATGEALATAGKFLTFSLGAGAPAGATVSASGLFSWTPALGQANTTNIIAVTVTDNGVALPGVEVKVVDLDDCMTGPAMQDLWMLLSGRPAEMSAQLADLLEGYGEFADFDYHEISLIEPLRTLRIMHYAGWLARRWEDPAFPRAFPWFQEPKYWEEHVLNLREQIAAMEEEPLHP